MRMTGCPNGCARPYVAGTCLSLLLVDTVDTYCLSQKLLSLAKLQVHTTCFSGAATMARDSTKFIEVSSGSSTSTSAL